MLGPEHPANGESLDNLASLLHDQGDLAAARPLYERALAIREKVLGPDHPQTAQCLNNLAALLQDQGDLAGGAAALRARAGDLRAGARPRSPQHQSRAAQSGPPAAGDRWRRRRPWGSARAALAAHENALGPEHAWTKDSARVTADALDALGRTDEATALRERYGLGHDER